MTLGAFHKVQDKIQLLKQEVAKMVIGQEDMINGLLVGILTGGHILLEGVPGLAKTTTVNALAKALDLHFKRVQFTPDLLPSDILGAEIYDVKINDFKIKKGPIFTNILLADEINRAPAKVQSALLEVMQEKQVTLGDESFVLEKPFLVLATQNPVEQEGVYALPEAQLDRFMLKLDISYGSKAEEKAIAKLITSSDQADIQPVMNAQDIFALRALVQAVHIDDAIEDYIIELIFATREPSDYLQYGVSPRASIDLFRVSRAVAFLNGKDFVSPTDVAKAANAVLPHRLILSYEAEAQGIQAADMIQDILAQVAIP